MRLLLEHGVKVDLHTQNSVDIEWFQPQRGSPPAGKAHKQRRNRLRKYLNPWSCTDGMLCLCYAVGLTLLAWFGSTFHFRGKRLLQSSWTTLIPLWYFYRRWDRCIPAANQLTIIRRLFTGSSEFLHSKQQKVTAYKTKPISGDSFQWVCHYREPLSHEMQWFDILKLLYCAALCKHLLQTWIKCPRKVIKNKTEAKSWKLPRCHWKYAGCGFCTATEVT